MNEEIFNNVFLLIIIFLIIKFVSPEPNSVLFILKKYINYFSFQIRKVLGLLNSNEYFRNDKNFIYTHEDLKCRFFNI